MYEEAHRHGAKVVAHHGRAVGRLHPLLQRVPRSAATLEVNRWIVAQRDAGAIDAAVDAYSLLLSCGDATRALSRRTSRPSATGCTSGSRGTRGSARPSSTRSSRAAPEAPGRSRRRSRRGRGGQPLRDAGAWGGRMPPILPSHSAHAAREPVRRRRGADLLQLHLEDEHPLRTLRLALVGELLGDPDRGASRPRPSAAAPRSSPG